jgi:hypothetical protein
MAPSIRDTMRPSRSCHHLGHLREDLLGADGAAHGYVGRSAGDEFKRFIDHRETEPLVEGNVGWICRFQVDRYALGVSQLKFIPHESRAKPPPLRFGTNAGDDQVPVSISGVGSLNIGSVPREPWEAPRIGGERP